LYGEAKKKVYLDPVEVFEYPFENCLILLLH